MYLYICQLVKTVNCYSKISYIRYIGAHYQYLLDNLAYFEINKEKQILKI